MAAFAGAVGLPGESAACAGEGPATVLFVSDGLFVRLVRAIGGAVEASRAGLHPTKVSPGSVVENVDDGCPGFPWPLRWGGKNLQAEGCDFLTAV